MSDDAATKADLRARLDVMTKSWNEIVSSIPESAADSDGADLSIADVLGHLFGWRVLTVDRLEAAVNNSGAPDFPWPDGMSEDTDEGTDEINEYFRQTYQALSLADLISASNAQIERIYAALDAISDADLFSPGRFAWLSGYPVSAVIDGVLEHFHVDHEAELRGLIAR